MHARIDARQRQATPRQLGQYLAEPQPGTPAPKGMDIAMRVPAPLSAMRMHRPAGSSDTAAVTPALPIGTDGRVADSKVEISSGFRERDRAAQVGLGLCKFRPGTVDGAPQQSWTRMQYVWSLD
jgi:protein TonB